MVAVTEKRDPEDIMQQLFQDTENPRVFILGCGGCAALLNTGGEKQVQELARTLSSRVPVTGTACIPGVCVEDFTAAVLHRHRDQIADSTAIIVLSCGGGVMAVRNSVDNIQVISGLITLGLGAFTGSPELATENLCQVCGNPCGADSTEGLCTITLCPQKRTEGPCPENSYLQSKMCVVTGERPCVWWDINQKACQKRASPEVQSSSRTSRILLPFLSGISRWIPLFRSLLRSAQKRDPEGKRKEEGKGKEKGNGEQEGEEGPAH